MKELMKALIMIVALVGIVGFVCKQCHTCVSLLFVHQDISADATSYRPNGTRQHFILTIQCMLFILLPMYINMAFAFNNSQESEAEALKPGLEMGASLKCTISKNTMKEIEGLLAQFKSTTPMLPTTTSSICEQEVFLDAQLNRIEKRSSKAAGSKGSVANFPFHFQYSHAFQRVFLVDTSIMNRRSGGLVLKRKVLLACTMFFIVNKVFYWICWGREDVHKLYKMGKRAAHAVSFGMNWLLVALNSFMFLQAVVNPFG